MISKSSYRIYLASLWIKVVFAVVELAAGIEVYFVTIPQIRRLTSWILHLRIFADGHDRKTIFVQHALGNLPMNAKTFLAVYLALHGLLKIGLVAGLLSGKRWAYPLGLIGLGAFVFYQVFHYAKHGNAIILVFAAFDIFIMWMVWKEWREKVK